MRLLKQNNREQHDAIKFTKTNIGITGSKRLEKKEAAEKRINKEIK